MRSLGDGFFDWLFEDQHWKKMMTGWIAVFTLLTLLALKQIHDQANDAHQQRNHQIAALAAQGRASDRALHAGEVAVCRLAQGSMTKLLNLAVAKQPTLKKRQAARKSLAPYFKAVDPKKCSYFVYVVTKAKHAKKKGG